MTSPSSLTPPISLPPSDAPRDASCHEGCCGQAIALRPNAAKLPPRDESGHPQDRANPDPVHDHGPLPGMRRLLIALALALGAELGELLLPDGLAWRALGMALALAAITLAGTGIYLSGLRALLRGRLGIDTLMAVAVTGAFLIGQWPEAAMVMALYALAERIEHRATDRARNAIAGLMALAPDEAQLQDAQGQWQRVPVHQVPLGGVILIRPGERVPLDGVIRSGSSALDQASVTGESVPVDKTVGDAVFAATVNQGGELQVQVNAAAGHTTLDRIIQAVEQAQSARAPTQSFVERFAAVYTPVIFVLAVALALLPPLLWDWPWLDAMYRALVLLVIACPCALVISTPVTMVSGLTAAARRGILIKGGVHLEAARRLRAVALDKTGTLTVGRPTLVHWQSWTDAPTEAIAAQTRALALRSDHPVAQAIAAGLPADAQTATLALDGLRAWPGRGVEARLDGNGLLRLGNLRWMKELGLSSPELESTLEQHERQGRSVTLLADTQAVRALFAVADVLKPRASAAVAALHAQGVTPALLSGDNASTTRAVAAQAGIADARGGLLPEEKQTALRDIRQRYGPTAMVGDGINDAPALAQADLGFAMGGAGTDIAIEAADVVIMNDDLGRIAETIHISRRTHIVLWQNIALALGIKAVVFALALTGQATMWMAVLADMGASLLVLGNGLRLLRLSQAPAKAAAL